MSPRGDLTPNNSGMESPVPMRSYGDCTHIPQTLPTGQCGRAGSGSYESIAEDGIEDLRLAAEPNRRRSRQLGREPRLNCEDSTTYCVPLMISNSCG